MKRPRQIFHMLSAVLPTTLWLLVALAVAALATAARSAAQEQRCFGNDPARRVCIEGRFLPFWEQQGGAAVLGEPVAAASIQTTPDGAFTVQYFDQARLELHPGNPAPYDVLLGRLGAERLRALGRAAEMERAETSRPECRFFEATRHNVCGAFLEYWRSHGLRLDTDPRVAEAESLALLGLPITAAANEAGPAGQAPLTQWFERGRLVQRADGTVSVAPIGREMPAAGVPAQAATPTLTPARGTSPTPTAAATATPTSNVAPALAPPPSPTRQAAFNVPVPHIPCNRNVPAAANGLQLWLTDPSPPSWEDQAVACVRLILDGQAVAGANAIVYRHYDNETRPTITHTTANDGVAGFIFYIGPGSPGMPASLEAVVSYRGTTYRTTIGLR